MGFLENLPPELFFKIADHLPRYKQGLLRQVSSQCASGVVSADSHLGMDSYWHARLTIYKFLKKCKCQQVSIAELLTMINLCQYLAIPYIVPEIIRESKVIAGYVDINTLSKEQLIVCLLFCPPRFIRQCFGPCWDYAKTLFEIVLDESNAEVQRLLRRDFYGAVLMSQYRLRAFRIPTINFGSLYDSLLATYGQIAELLLSIKEKFYYRNLQDIDLHRKKLRRLHFDYANLINAKLYNCDLHRGSFVGANLSGARLQCAKLAFANFQSATLENANLWRADLFFAKLRYANLRSANMGETYLLSTDFTGSFQGGVKNNIDYWCSIL